MEVINKTSYSTQEDLKQVSEASYTTQDNTNNYLTREELVSKFNTFDKKDDISDAIVQAYLSEVA
jgi:hypothetical protein